MNCSGVSTPSTTVDPGTTVVQRFARSANVGPYTQHIYSEFNLNNSGDFSKRGLSLKGFNSVSPEKRTRIKLPFNGQKK